MPTQITTRLAGLAVAIGLGAAAAPLSAQATFRACYVPDVGAIYMIGVQGLPQDCLSTNHVEFSWADGGPVEIPDGSVTAAMLADGAVTTAKIQDGAVAQAKLAFGAATIADLEALGEAGQINSAENPVAWSRLKGVPAGIADGVDNTGGTSTDVDCDGCVGTAEIADGAVTEGKLGFEPATQAALTAHAGSDDHDPRYATRTELSATRVINTPGNPVHWSALIGVPSDFADGADDTGGTPTDLVCDECVGTTDLAAGAVSTVKLGFDPATQAELDSHGASADHDGRYATRSELRSSTGFINQSDNLVHWAQLVGVPPEIADGDDANTTTATDVSCNGCIGAIDIDAGAVGASELNIDLRRVSATVSVDVISGTSVACPSGYELLSGGWNTTNGDIDVHAFDSYPDTSVNPQRWRFRFVNHSGTDASITVYAMCANVG